MVEKQLLNVGGKILYTYDYICVHAYIYMFTSRFTSISTSISIVELFSVHMHISGFEIRAPSLSLCLFFRWFGYFRTIRGAPRWPPRS